MVRRVIQSSLIYLTIASTIVLPIVLVLWARSYTVDDSIIRQGNGRATVLRFANGEVSFWIAPTDPRFRYFEHREREPRQGSSANRVFSRVPASVMFDTAGFALAELDYIPARGIMSTGHAVGGIVPIWFFALLCSILPVRLLLRNTQSSAEWTRQREVEQAEKRDQAEQEPATPIDEQIFIPPSFSNALPHRPIRTAASMRRWR